MIYNMTVEVKICGLDRPETVDGAVDAGAEKPIKLELTDCAPKIKISDQLSLTQPEDCIQ